MKKLRGELVRFRNSAGLNLDGIFYQQDSNDVTIVHIHGSFGNFYQNEFLKILAREYYFSGINFLLFNLTCHDGFGEGYRENYGLEYVGGAVSNFSTCIDDIAAAVDYTAQHSNQIILQGHSLGCERTLYYLITTGAKLDFILLSPCDSYQLQTRWLVNESIEEQIKRLEQPNGKEHQFDWLPLKEYGIREGDEWTYPLPITRNALLSLIESDGFQLTRLDAPKDFYIDANSLVYLGGNDSLLLGGADSMYRHLETRIRQVARMYISHGDHMLQECEKEVAHHVVEWCKAQK